MKEIKFTELFLKTTRFFPSLIEIMHKEQNKIDSLTNFYNTYIDNLYESGIFNDFQNLMSWHIRIALKKQLLLDNRILDIHKIDIFELHNLFMIDMKDEYYQNILNDGNHILIDDFSEEFIIKWKKQKDYFSE